MQGIDIIRLSEKQKQQLIILKRKTGIENWNVLCRWALCMSLADPTVPPMEDIPSDSNVEMSWRTLGGEFSHVYAAILKIKQKRQESNTPIEKLLKQHLSRGLHLLLKDSATKMLI